MNFVLLIFIFISSLSQADIKQPITEILAGPVDEFGSATPSRSVQNYSIKDSAKKNSLTDSMNSISGVQMRLDGSPTFSIRGSQSSTRTLVLQEGIPLNFGDGLGFNPLFITTENLESVRLLKGPSSSEFGRDAMAGAAEFREKILNGAESFLSLGSFNSKGAFAGYGGNLSNNLFFQSTAFQEHSDGSYRDRNDQETLRTTLQLRWKNNSESENKIQLSTYHLLARKIGSTPGATDFPSPQAYQSIGHLHALKIGFKNPYFAAKSQTSLAVLDQYYMPTNISRTQSVRQNLRVQKQIGNVNIELFDEMSFERFSANYFLTEQSLQLNEFGSALHAPLNEKLELSAAGRIDTTSSEIFPTITLTQLNENNWITYASYATGFKPPSITQKLAQTSDFVGNPNLKSEHSTEIDLGFQKKFESSDFTKSYVHFEVFRRDMTDLVQNIPISTTTSSPRNITSASAFGFELDGTHSWDNFSGLLSVGYLQSRTTDYTTGLQQNMTLSPQIQFAAALEKKWNKFSSKIQNTYWSTYSDRSFSTGNLIDLGPWDVTDLFFSFELSQIFSISLSVLNVFDQPRQFTLNYPEPLRTYKLLLNGVF